MVGVRYDVVIDGSGYVFWVPLMQSLPFRNQRAAYAFSPTFVERSNVSGSYGDNEQDFFLTDSQADWSEGQGQRFFRSNDTDSARKYWAGTGIDVSLQGQVTMARAAVSVSQGSAIAYAACQCQEGIGINSHAYSGVSHLFTVDYTGAVTDQGAHGAGTPTQWGLCTDGNYMYIAGSSKIRKWDGSTFTDFSASSFGGGIGSLATLNNSLYACDGSTLTVFDTSGSPTTLFAWKYNQGSAQGPQAAKIVPFGGDLLIFFPLLDDRPQLWMYDGADTHQIADLPQSVMGYDIQVVEGVVYMSGIVSEAPGGGPLGQVPIVYYYLNGTLDELWRSQAAPAAVAGGATRNSLYAPALGVLAGRLVFTDPGGPTMNVYDTDSGSVSAVCSYTITTAENQQFSSSTSSVLLTNHSSNRAATIYPSSSAFVSAATVVSSLFDFDNSLTKLFRGVKVEWSGGGSVDIAYQVDSLAGSYTSLQTGAVSGTEYVLSGITGRAISIRATLNNSSGNIPTLTRVYVRAAPVQQSFRRVQYVLDLTGSPYSPVRESNPVQLRDSTTQLLTGFQMAQNLTTSIKATAPIQVSDSFGTYTAVFEQGPGVTELDEVRPGEYVAQVTLREV